MRRETDILMEKHALNKIKKTYFQTQNDHTKMPSVRLITTFKDHLNLYFLTEMFRSKNEVWEHCRSFGMLQEERSKYTFLKICLCVKKLHDLDLIHRDLKPENMFFASEALDSVKLIDLGSAEDLSDPSIRQTFIDDN